MCDSCYTGYLSNPIPVDCDCLCPPDSLVLKEDKDGPYYMCPSCRHSVGD